LAVGRVFDGFVHLQTLVLSVGRLAKVKILDSHTFIVIPFLTTVGVLIGRPTSFDSAGTDVSWRNSAAMESRYRAGY
jgi:hypothetical protein